MFFSVYRLMLVHFQGARGLPLPEENCVLPEYFGFPKLPVRTKGSGSDPFSVGITVSELMPIYDDTDNNNLIADEEVLFEDLSDDDAPLFEELSDDEEVLFEDLSDDDDAPLFEELSDD